MDNINCLDLDGVNWNLLCMVLGLTGSFGCGKTTVAELFVKAGAKLVDSDQAVCEIYQKDEGLRADLRSRFGDEVFSESGEVNRKALADIVFSDRSELIWLENRIHPQVAKHRNELIATDPDGLWIVEIPLLFEKNLESEVDYSISVLSSYSKRVDRLKNRGFSPEEVASRSARQLPQNQKAIRADYVILNDGSLEFLGKQVQILVNQLKN